MIIVDSHVHLGVAPSARARGSIPSTFLAEALIESMDRNGIKRSVIFAYGRLLNESNKHNMAVYDAVLKYPERLVGFVRPNPWYEDSVMDIDLFVGELGFKGIKLHSGMESFPVNARIVYPIIEKASQYHIPVLIDGNPALIGDWADEFPEVTFIIPHMAGRSYQTAFFVAKKCENVMLETSVNSWTHRILRSAVDLLGPERILWGSDTPFHTPEVELKKVEMSKLTDAEKEMILWKNVCRLLKIDIK